MPGKKTVRRSAASRVTGAPSIAAVRWDIPERTGNTPGLRAADMRGARNAIAKKTGWTGNPRDKKEARYNPKRKPR